MLKVKNLRKAYKIGEHKINALDDVSFDLPNRKLVAIVGPSGCGKSTLMNILGALDSDFKGEVIVNGKSLKEACSKDIDTYRKNTIGFIFQQFNLLNSQTSMQNVELALELSGSSKKTKKEKAMELLNKVGLSQQSKKKVNLLSGGQRQRVAIARALANDPEIILADEPTGALDHKTGKQIMDLLKEISKERLILMVTHAPELAKEYADLIINMEDGKILSIEENLQTTELQEECKKSTSTKSKMSILTALKLSLRSTWLKKGRTIATAIGTAIGISGIALAIAITTGTTKSVNTQVKSIFPSNSVMVGFRENVDKAPSKFKNLKYDDVEKIKALGNEFYAYYFPIHGEGIPMTSFFSLDKSVLEKENFFETLSEQETIQSLIDMMSPGVIEDVENDIQYGTLPEKGALDEVVISLSTAKNLVKGDEELDSLIGKNIYVSFVEPPKASDMLTGKNNAPKITILPWEIVGIANTTTLMNTYYTRSEWGFDYYQKHFNIDKNNLEISAMVFYGKDKNTIDKEVARLNEAQDIYQFELAGKTITQQVDSTMKQVRMGLLGFAGVSIVVAALMIAIVIYISVIERTNEIGILRAIGARKRDITNIFVAEAFIIGVLSAVIGIGIAMGISQLINKLVYGFLQNFANNVPYMEVAELTPIDTVAILIFCIIVSVIAGLYPSFRAAKMDPIDALRKN